MGRAIVREPQVFLLDEPLSNLDAKLRVQMRTTVSRLQNQLDTTTVYVTHDQVEAMTLGDRVAVMRGDVTVPADLAVKVQRAGAGRNLIVGIRPEDFEDAALMDGRRAEGLTFPADVDVLESLGAEK
jgi:multiple sugar transport system ATP-binding protein